jgi:PKD repeat protein
VGSAVIQADQTILAEVSRSSGIALASYAAPWGGGNELAAPLIQGSSSESAVSTVATQNLADRSNIMAQTYDAGCALCPGRIVILDPTGNDFVAQAYTASRPLYIFNNGKAPLASVVAVDSVQPGEAGSAAYAAFDVGRLGHQAAAPLAYGGYEGWYTRIWVQNLGATTTTVTLTYTLLTSPGSFALSASEKVVGPGQTATFAPPTTTHASAIAQADQPIAMLVEGYNDGLALEDGRFYYRGTPFGPPLARFSVNSPVEPRETAYFENLSVAVPPVSFEWDFGDDALSSVENPAHTYHASGAHTVAMTATNLYGSATASAVVEAFGPPLAGFESSSPDPLGQATFFANTSTGLPAASSFRWDFGDSGVSTEENPSHIFASFGRHWVVLTATNAYGSDTYVGRVDITEEGLYVVYLPVLLKTLP